VTSKTKGDMSKTKRDDNNHGFNDEFDN